VRIVLSDVAVIVTEVVLVFVMPFAVLVDVEVVIEVLSNK
jgi:hypothetical protein